MTPWRVPCVLCGAPELVLERYEVTRVGDRRRRFRWHRICCQRAAVQTSATCESACESRVIPTPTDANQRGDA